MVRDGEKLLASRQIVFSASRNIQAETLLFSAGSAGAKTLQFSIDPMPGEENRANNGVARLLSVDSGKRRILYVEGEPRWEYKFIRRAEDDDHLIQLASMLRTTLENKLYRQGVSGARTELPPTGSPPARKICSATLGIISIRLRLGNPDISRQPSRSLIKQFAVDRRGGGLLFLGGRFALADGGWSASPVADVLPTVLPGTKNTFHREAATVALTATGTDSLITRLVDDPAKNVDRWKKLPYLMDYQEPGTPKPGAAVLAEMSANGRRFPLLTTQNYGRGRTAVLATSGTWRWQMSQPLGDTTHDMFWRQLLRWVVTDTPANVVASVPSQILLDDGRIRISAEVRDKEYQTAADAKVEAHILGPGNLSASLDMAPVPDSPGVFSSRVDRAETGILSDGSNGPTRRRRTRPRCIDLSENGRRRRKLPYRAEPASCSKNYPRRRAADIGSRKNFRSLARKYLYRRPVLPIQRITRKSCGICQPSF